CSVTCIGTGVTDCNELIISRGLYFKFYYSSFTTSDPVTLNLFDILGPVYFVEVAEKSIGVFSYPQLPLFHIPFYHCIAFFGLLCDFFIGENGSKLRTPIDRTIGEICQAL